MNYEHKFFKYKNKYIKLKNFNNQIKIIGGGKYKISDNVKIINSDIYKGNKGTIIDLWHCCDLQNLNIKCEDTVDKSNKPIVYKVKIINDSLMSIDELFLEEQLKLIGADLNEIKISVKEIFERFEKNDRPLQILILCQKKIQCVTDKINHYLTKNLEDIPYEIQFMRELTKKEIINGDIVDIPYNLCIFDEYSACGTYKKSTNRNDIEKNEKNEEDEEDKEDIEKKKIKEEHNKIIAEFIQTKEKYYDIIFLNTCPINLNLIINYKIISNILKDNGVIILSLFDDSDRYDEYSKIPIPFQNKDITPDYLRISSNFKKINTITDTRIFEKCFL